MNNEYFKFLDEKTGKYFHYRNSLQMNYFHKSFFRGVQWLGCSNYGMDELYKICEENSFEFWDDSFPNDLYTHLVKNKISSEINLWSLKNSIFTFVPCYIPQINEVDILQHCPRLVLVENNKIKFA